MSETKSRAIICIPLCERRADQLLLAMKRAAPLADLIELRLDCLDDEELAKALRELPALLREDAQPLILTLRPAEEGGRAHRTPDERCDFWSSHLPAGETARPVFADMESDLAALFLERARQGICEAPDWSRIICSHHDFARVPPDLENIYERMSATPARVLKLAVQAGDITDCLPVFRLMERARREGREIIAIAMGTAGIMTRILGPARGAFLTYGSLDTGHATAPGQVTAHALRELYRLDRLDQQTLITGLVGSPVLHSVSPHMHNAAFHALGLNAVYLPLEVGEVGPFLRRMVHPRTRELSWNMKGLSVTAPHKRAVMEHLDSFDRIAREVGAVNTILVEGDELLGSNTDAAAFIAPLEEKIGPTSGMSVAVIGAGGAARSALWALRAACAKVRLFARNVERAGPLATEFGATFEGLEGARFDRFDVVVNATPLGTRGASENRTPATADQLRGARLAYDLVYNPAETRFLREATEAGCATLGGLPMLVAQAAAQLKLWTGHDAPLELMRRAAADALDQ